MSDCCRQGRDSRAPAVLECPVNGARCKRVDMITVKSLVRSLSLGMPATDYYFCDARGCDVVYFPLDARAPIFRRGDLLVRVGAKEESGPAQVCYCFGFTRQDVWDEICQTGESAIAEQITAEVKAGTCACEVKNPSGKCCLGEIAQVVQGCLRKSE